jgi:hypothetical protein
MVAIFEISLMAKNQEFSITYNSIDKNFQVFHITRKPDGTRDQLYLVSSESKDLDACALAAENYVRVQIRDRTCAQFNALADSNAWVRTDGDKLFLYGTTGRRCFESLAELADALIERARTGDDDAFQG